MRPGPSHSPLVFSYHLLVYTFNLQEEIEMSRRDLLGIFFEKLTESELEKSNLEDVADNLLNAIVESGSEKDFFPVNAITAEYIHETLNPNYDRRMGFNSDKYSDTIRIFAEALHRLVTREYLAPHINQGNPSYSYFVTRWGKDRCEKLNFPL